MLHKTTLSSAEATYVLPRINSTQLSKTLSTHFSQFYSSTTQTMKNLLDTCAKSLSTKVMACAYRRNYFCNYWINSIIINHIVF